MGLSYELWLGFGFGFSAILIKCVWQGCQKLFYKKIFRMKTCCISLIWPFYPLSLYDSINKMECHLHQRIPEISGKRLLFRKAIYNLIGYFWISELSRSNRPSNFALLKVKYMRIHCWKREKDSSTPVFYTVQKKKFIPLFKKN